MGTNRGDLSPSCGRLDVLHTYSLLTVTSLRKYIDFLLNVAKEYKHLIMDDLGFGTCDTNLEISINAQINTQIKMLSPDSPAIHIKKLPPLLT